MPINYTDGNGAKASIERFGGKVKLSVNVNYFSPVYRGWFRTVEAAIEKLNTFPYKWHEAK